MDEIVGALVEQLAKRAREEAARRAQAAAGAAAGSGAPPRSAVRPAASSPAPGIVTPRRAPPPPAAPRAAAPPPTVVFSPSPAAPPAPPAPVDVFANVSQDIGFGDPFGMAAAVASAPAAVSSRSETAPALLSAFAGGQSLLAAIVLSEALAPPVALRSTPPV